MQGYTKVFLRQGNGTLVVPLWSSAPYWALLHDNLGNLREFITDKQNLIYIHSVIVPVRGNNCVWEICEIHNGCIQDQI
jgi:hypothetical protein